MSNHITTWRERSLGAFIGAEIMVIIAIILTIFALIIFKHKLSPINDFYASIIFTGVSGAIAGAIIGSNGKLFSIILSGCIIGIIILWFNIYDNNFNSYMASVICGSSIGSISIAIFVIIIRTIKEEFRMK